MRGLTASELLDVFERGRPFGDAERALLLLESAGDQDAASLGALSVGRRDALLWELRERTFGSHLEGAFACPGCGETLELSLSVEELRARSESDGAPGIHLSIEGHEIDARVPTCDDLVAVERQPDLSSARRLLLERCVRCTSNGRRRSTTRLPRPVVERVGEELAAANGRSVTELELRCPACGEVQAVAFDIASFLWNEVRAWAPRLLEEAHTLAATHGWSEADILGMSAWRRRAYLELAAR
jgi:hypothetical protein